MARPDGLEALQANGSRRKARPRSVMGAALVAGLMLLSMPVSGQAELCGGLKDVVGHVPTDFEALRAFATKSGDVPPSKRLPQAESCWIRKNMDGIWKFWCSWKPGTPAALGEETKAFADKVAGCFPGATIQHYADGDRVWARIALKDKARFYVNADRDTKTIDIAIDKDQ
jgi:hypothetical protein